MIRLKSTLNHAPSFFILPLLLLGGCGAEEQPKIGPLTGAVPRFESFPEPIMVQETEPLVLRPILSNPDEVYGKLNFKLMGGTLPQGCQFDETTGEVNWTPDEIQGPGQYQLRFACTPALEPTQVTEYALLLEVGETNQPPELTAPLEATLAAGDILELPIALSDADFPANQLSLELTSGPEKASVDAIRKVLYWEIPADWQESQVEITVTARDDGTPPLSTSQTLAVTVTDIAPAPTEGTESGNSHERIPEVAIDLPSLPRPKDAIVTTPLEISFDPPLVENDVRLSIMLPHDLRALLKPRYLDDQPDRLALLLTDPFEAEEVEGNLQDGIVATCELINSQFVWTWALTKDLDARGYQNNIRNGVLVVESNGAPPRLVALQKMVTVPAPTVESMLNDDKLQATLLRHERIKKNIPFASLDSSVVVDNWSTSLDSQINGFALQLFHPKLTQQVNTGTRVSAMQFTEFGFRVLPEATEISISLDAKPSPTDLFQSRTAARNALKKKQTNYRNWSKKLQGAQNKLSTANALPARNDFERKDKQTRVNQATFLIRQAEKELAVLAVEIPADENLVAKMEQACDAIVAQLEPLRNCIVTGEFSRLIDDVRVPVIKLVPVAVDSAVVAEGDVIPE